MKRSVWCIMLLALCLAVWPDTLVVYPNRGPTLQQTVDQARSGDTIRVGEGISLYWPMSFLAPDTDLRRFHILSSRGPSARKTNAPFRFRWAAGNYDSTPEKPPRCP